MADFDDVTIQAVWEKGVIVFGEDSAMWREEMYRYPTVDR